MNAKTLTPATENQRTRAQMERRLDAPCIDGFRTISTWMIGPKVENISRSCESVALGGKLPTKMEHRSALARLDADCGDGNMRPGLDRCMGDSDAYCRPP